jgi:hypothetical protein
MKHYISLGAGVQSSTLALMASHGEIGPMPEAAIFADTQDEPKSVYDWLDWLESKLAFPVIRVTNGKLSESALDLRTSKRGTLYTKTTLPVFTTAPDGSGGMVARRSCTSDFKIEPILKELKKLAGVKRGQKEAAVTSWIGISTDEIQRVKPSRVPWAVNRHPLIEKRMTRLACLDWMRKNKYPDPPKSSCVFCAFHSDSEWRRLKTQEPEAFAQAVEFEKNIQKAKAADGVFNSIPFLHRSRTPLDQIDFSNDTDRGQLLLWQDECEGMCGV